MTITHPPDRLENQENTAEQLRLRYDTTQHREHHGHAFPRKQASARDT